ncbi:MAG: GMC family oxidoreductase [Gemmatimonadaceae bacterium]|nr:GMC family oxidoreductase [Gemmatimonadaceae bacterium]
MVAPVRRPPRPGPVVGWPLSPAQRATLDALAATVVPIAATPEGGGVAVATLVAERLARFPADKRRDLLRALTVFGHPLASLLTTGRLRRFAARDADGRAAMLETWLTSRLALCRTIAQGLRRLLLALYYGDPRSHAGIGYLGPYHERVPAFPWEGPVPGTPSDDEPVARGPAPQLPPPTPTPALTRPGATAPLPRSADVVVIGTGAGGAVAACRLAEAGRRVVMLEAGPLVQSDEFSEQDAALTERLWADQGLRATDDLSLIMAQGTAVGGSTTINWMIMLRAADHVLLEWKQRFGTVGMAPYEMADAYARIEAEVHARLVPDDAHSPSNRLILDGAKALGWSARAGHINAKGCLRCGFCSTGCRYEARQGMLVTFVPRALAAGATLVPDARAERIEVVEAGPRGRKRVTVVRTDPATGAPRTETIEAPVVVLAGGAVGTPLLLQRSGLGSPAVGRYLRVHPVSAVVGLYDRPIYSAGGIPLTTLCDEFSATGANGYGTWIETPPTHPTLLSAALPGFGADHRALMRRFPDLAALLVLTRDGAELDVSSGEVRARPDGTASIRYALTPTDARHLASGLEHAARLHLANGAQEILTTHTRPIRIRHEADLAAIGTASLAPNDVALFTAHVNGTCRLGVDPATSGANPDGQVHGVPGVYVMDGSLLPTGLGVNPQATIMAISSMLADRLLARNAV